MPTRFIAMLFAACAVLSSSWAAAQGWPAKPIHIVLPKRGAAYPLHELIETAAQITLASVRAGPGPPPHLSAERPLRAIAKVGVVHVPHALAGPPAAPVDAGEPPVACRTLTA